VSRYGRRRCARARADSGAHAGITWVRIRRGDAHPFVVGQDAYQRFLTVMGACGEAQLARR